MNPIAAVSAALLLATLAGCLGGGPPGAPPEADPEPAADSSRSVQYPADGQGNATASPRAPAFDVLDTGFDAGEPTIGFTADGTAFVVAGLQTLRSGDLGAWEPVLSAPTTSDPMMAIDPVTDRVFTVHMLGGNCANLWWSDDGGDSWTARPAGCVVPVVDFLKAAAGPPGPGANPHAAAAQSVLYVCKNTNAGMSVATTCYASYDGGLTFPVESVVAARARDGCGGVTGFPVVRSDGVVAAPVGNGCAAFTLGVSEDSGLTWSVRRGPDGFATASATPEVAFTDDGTLYAYWRTPEGRALLARSGDLGQTWAGPFDLTPPGVQSLVFEALDAGAPGRVAVAFLGSATAADSSSAMPADGAWHLWVVRSDDADGDAPTFEAVQATPEQDPVQRGPVCFGGSGCGRNLGDFLHSALDPDGRFHVVYTDGCADGCPDAEGQSRDRDVHVLRLHEPLR